MVTPYLEEPLSRQLPRLTIDQCISQGDAELFTELLLSELPAFYDDVDSSFPDSILQSATQGFDEFGYFTLWKRIVVGRLEARPVAFTVVTRKRGGAVKIGPTAVIPELRGNHLGTLFRRQVESQIFVDRSVRKLYVTISQSNARSLAFNMSLGYKIEGLLKDQYRGGSSELVLGKFRNSRARVDPLQQLNRLTNLPATHSPERLDLTFTPPSSTELAQYMLPRLTSAFSELDDGFVRAILAACAPNRQTYSQKGKWVIAGRGFSNQLQCLAVGVPKRGGAVKICPLLADDIPAAEALLDECVEVALSQRRRKIYLHIPLYNFPLISMAQRKGFQLEAQLREAYKANADILSLGLALG